MKIKQSHAVLALVLAVCLFVSCGAATTTVRETTQVLDTTNTPGAVVDPMLSYYPERDPTSGVYAAYFKGTARNDFIGGEIVSTIEAVFPTGKEPYSGVGKTHYSIRYTGFLLAPASGNFTFTTAADDGARLTIDNKTVINDQGPHITQEVFGKMTLTKDKYYPFTLDYYNGELGGDISLYWQGPGIAKQIIPEEAYFLPGRYAEIYLADEDGGIAIHAEPIAFAGGATVVVMKKVNGRFEKIKEEALGSEPIRMTAVDLSVGDIVRAYIEKDGLLMTDIVEKTFGVDHTVTVDLQKEAGEVSAFLYGACMEDVNHELYGGIWSQMIYGEKFAEPSNTSSLQGDFTISDGNFSSVVKDGEEVLKVEQGADGPKLTFNNTETSAGSASMKLFLDGDGPIGFIIKGSNLKPGADNFYGYEVAIGNNFVRFARHQNNYTLLKEVICNAPKGTWVELTVEYTETTFKIFVNGQLAITYTDSAIKSGAVGLRAWNATGYFKDIRVTNENGEEKEIAYSASKSVLSVSKCWDITLADSVKGSAVIDTVTTFKGQQTQKLLYTVGSGDMVLSNGGLNRMGMSFVKDKDYEGYLYASAKSDTVLTLKLTSKQGDKVYATTTITVKSGDFQKYTFAMTSNSTDADGAFAIVLSTPAEVNFGYVFLQPGEWGRYQGLPVRRDVVEGMFDAGLQVLRFGGCMANAADYKWKSMIGAPEDRPTYGGWWYPYSSFGFGIIEFMDLCEAMDILYIPDFNQYESPEDMADFVRFAVGTDENDEWVKLRKAMGREEPYRLKMIQIGNEEKVDAAYAARFNAIADAVKEIAPELILVVGDFQYNHIITNPYSFTGCDSGITSLAAHKVILDNAVKNGQTVWFDIHFWSETGDQPASLIEAAFSLYDALKMISPKSDPKLCVFELNANSHHVERALCNAFAINAAKTADIFPIVCSANCLQVQGQNDNGWNQGLVFMDSDEVWLQPPALVAKLLSTVHQKGRVAYTCRTTSVDLHIAVTKSEDRKTVVLTVVNRHTTAKTLSIEGLDIQTATVQSVGGALSLVNTAGDSNRVKLSESQVISGNIVELPANSVIAITVTVK